MWTPEIERRETHTAARLVTSKHVLSVCSPRALAVRWGSDCWCLRTCSAMQLQLVAIDKQGRAGNVLGMWAAVALQPVWSPRAELGSGRQFGPTEVAFGHVL